jgi:hypothetical protein
MDFYNNSINNLQVAQVPSGATAEIALPANWSMTNSFPVGTGLQIPATNFTLGRNVIVYSMGNIGNPTSALLGFYPSGFSNDDIQKTLPLSNSSLDWGQSIYPKGVNIQPCDPNLSSTFVTNILLVSQDYNATRRFAYPSSYYSNPGVPNSGATTQSYATGISGAALTLPLGKSYSDIGAGALIGWYGTSAGTAGSAFGITGLTTTTTRTQFESAWLTQTGVNTYLNLSFFVVSGIPPNSPVYKVGIIR